ncbi:MAG: zinc ribbon domain-containing protein [Clostridiales bacterium]|nr:zinc ribbon domain-containing protein [Clostridiales bacterium]
MFFIMGITEGRKRFDQLLSIICPHCGAASRAVVYMTYTCLSLFFIPTFKWNKRYFVEMDCCDTVYILNEEKGKEIAAGKDVVITASDLTEMNSGYYEKRCPDCGTVVDRSFEYCPRCGRKLK